MTLPDLDRLHAALNAYITACGKELAACRALHDTQHAALEGTIAGAIAKGRVTKLWRRVGKLRLATDAAREAMVSRMSTDRITG